VTGPLLRIGAKVRVEPLSVPGPSPGSVHAVPVQLDRKYADPPINGGGTAIVKPGVDGNVTVAAGVIEK
jgi:hypothetical protein